MLRSIKTICLAAAAVVVSSAAALAGPQDFSVVNYSDQELGSVFVVPDYAGKWGLDALGDLIVGPGEYVDITVNGYGDYCMFNVWVVTTIGEIVEFAGINLCEIKEITIESEGQYMDPTQGDQMIFG